MHNEQHEYASRETAESGFEPLGRICRHCRGEKRHSSRSPALAQPTCGETCTATRTGDLQDDLLVRSPRGFELTLRGREILQDLEALLPKMENLVAPGAGEQEPVFVRIQF